MKRKSHQDKRDTALIGTDGKPKATLIWVPIDERFILQEFKK